MLTFGVLFEYVYFFGFLLIIVGFLLIVGLISASIALITGSPLVVFNI